MQVSTKLLQLTTLAMVVGLAILLYTQFQWIDQAKRLTQQNFNERVYAAMTDISKSQETNGLAYFQTKLAATKLLAKDSVALAALLNKLIHSSMRKDNLALDFRFALAKNDDESTVILGNIPPAAGSVCQFKVRDLLCMNTHRFVALYFPEKENFLSAELQKTLLPGMLSMVLIFSTFIISGYIMVRQKKVSELQKDFVNNLTHDFKTPLFTISMAADVIKNNKEPEKNKIYSQLIKNESSRLAQQVDKVLQHAIIDAGYFQLEKKEVDLKKIIEKAISSFSIIMETNGGSMVSLINTANSGIVADEFHMYNALCNLLDNAIKFSQDKPQILVEVTEIDNALHIKVKDNGIGIHPCFHKRIFKKFYRPQPEGYKGFGLGLSYVKKVVEAHESKICLDSLPGKGSTFSFTLPAAKGLLYA